MAPLQSNGEESSDKQCNEIFSKVLERATWSESRRILFLRSLGITLNDNNIDALLEAIHSSNWEKGKNSSFFAGIGNLTDQQITRKIDILVKSGIDRVTAKLILSTGCLDVPVTEYDAQWFDWKEKAILQAQLSAEESEAIDSYLSYGFYRLNQALRQLIPMTNEVQQKIIILKDSLKKLPSFKGTSYRVEFDKENVKHLKVGVIFKPNYFFSTSVEKKSTLARIDANKKNCVFVVKSNNGSGKQVQDFSFFKSETEILFSEGTEFMVLDIFTEPNGDLKITIGN